MKYNAMLELKKHRAKYGTRYTLPDGSSKLIKDSEISSYLKNNGYAIRQPAMQALSIEEMQVGIK